jgi:hypothetical protein
MSRYQLGAWVPVLREALEQRGSFTWRMEGESMMPTLSPGCILEITPLPTRVSTGEVVVFARQDTLVVHRLVARSGARWRTQGDGIAVPDRPLDPGQALGVVAAAITDEGSRRPASTLRRYALLWILRYHLLRLWRGLQRLRQQ